MITAWWLLKDCLKTAIWLPYDCLMTVWWLPDDCLMTAIWLPDDCLMTSWWLPADCQLSAWWLPDDCQLTAWWLPDDCLMTAWRLSDDCLMTLCWLSVDFLMTAWWLPNDFMMTASWLPDDFLMSALWLSDDFMMTASWLPDFVLNCKTTKQKLQAFEAARSCEEPKKMKIQKRTTCMAYWPWHMQMNSFVHYDHAYNTIINMTLIWLWWWDIIAYFYRHGRDVWLLGKHMIMSTRVSRGTCKDHFKYNKDVGCGWAGWLIAHPGFGRSVNSIPTRGGRLYPWHYYLPTQL